MAQDKWVVFFHYNKPYSKRTGTHKWSVHFRGKCMMVSNISCLIPTHSKVNKIQPYVVMRGLAKEVDIENDTATIK
tara:strand:+ start:350 stop:577 length:228 start_codon:yes stop_codon:yes gene_type:complete